MDPMEERFDNIEVALGRMAISNDRGFKRLDRLERLMDRVEERGAETDRQLQEAIKLAAEDRRRSAEENRQRLEENQQRVAEERLRVEENRQHVEEERLRAKESRRRAEEYLERAEKDRQRAEQDRQRSEQDRQRSEADLQSAKEDRKAWNRKWGDLANKLGTLVEDIVAPNLPRIAKESLGCERIDDFMIRRQVRNKRDPSQRREFDLIAVCGDRVIINETKSKPSIEYINRFLEMLPRLGEYFPEYRGKTLVPVFSSLYLSEDVINYLSKHGVYGLAMGDETMQLVNGGQVSDDRLPTI